MTIQQTESYKLMRSFFYFNVYLLLRDCSLCRAVCAADCLVMRNALLPALLQGAFRHNSMSRKS